MSIYKKLADFQAQIHVVPFDKENPHFKSKFASLASVVKTCAPVLAKCGLAYSQIFVGGEIVTILADTETGEKIESIIRIPVAETANAQQIGSAVTYMKRYALLAILGVVGDDDDGNQATTAAPEQKPKQQHQSQMTDEQKRAAIPAYLEKCTSLDNLNTI